jgi:predicted nucleotidyltransferase component of viral defense system
MISSDEIKDIAAAVRLQPTVVEKDYAIGWLLAGIRQHSVIQNKWIFKGGTCLKKCYFETYRFSEDLDFTFTGGTQPTVEELTKTFEEISDWIMEQSGLEIPKNGISFESFENPRGATSIQGRAAYRGPILGKRNIQQIPRIKIDLTLDEPLVLPPVLRKVEHNYTDLPEGGIDALCYSFEEVFAEKTRALAQRLRPRDLYDVIHFYRRLDLNPDRSKVKDILKAKCDLRGIPIPTIKLLESHDQRAALESEWENQLKHQLPILPPFEEFLVELPLVLDWIDGRKVEQIEAFSESDDEETEERIVQESVEAMTVPGPGASMMEKVRFAASNRLLLQLGYNGSLREIEPYAFARSADGNLLLRAIKAQTGESRAYRWDMIQSLEVSSKPFRPRYQVEITSAGYQPVHQLTRAPRSSGARRLVALGTTHVFKCSSCGKQFRRKSMDGNLKVHKAPSGSVCYGGYGRFLRTEN